MKHAPHVAVVGAGWSGLACALRLTEAGCAVTVLDAAPQTGGRARRVDVALGDQRFALDNGQHLLIGAYRDTLTMMSAAGVDANTAFRRMPFTLRYPDGWTLSATNKVPAPFHLAFGLLRSTRMPWPQRIALAQQVRQWKHAGWRASPLQTAAELAQSMPSDVVARLLRPLCLAALNVDLPIASAQVFLNVLRDSLGAHARASDVLLPAADLSALFPSAAEKTLLRRGAQVRLSTPVDALMQGEQTSPWTIVSRAERFSADVVVLALPPWRAADLLAPLQSAPLHATVEQLRAIDIAPIATVYLRYAAATRLSHPFYVLRDDAAAQRFGQWVFDRGAGVLSVVISGTGPHVELDQRDLAQHVAAQLKTDLHLPTPIATRAITEKRATIVPAPGLHRPAAALPLPGLFLAGDAADSPYPSTIEGSVRSGLAAAQAVLVQR